MCVPSIAVQRYRELRAAGLSRSAIRRAVAAGDLHHLRRGVYASADACAEVMIAATHGGALACVSAARHWGLWVLEEPGNVHVWLHRDGHRRHAEDPCTCVEHWDEGTRDAFALPSAARVLRQILACAGVEAFFVALESARRTGIVGPAALRWLTSHIGGEGREAVALSRDDADSGLESLFRWRLRHHGLTVRTQVRIVGVGVVDVLVGDRLIVETDGKANHDSPSLRHKDLLRDAHAALWGYVTLRFDYAMIVHEWDLVESAILASVASGHHLVPGR
ncbi:DUF559 domain-containing protein [Microbacterium sp.]|uniref:DUF559 domain-containing protein n=1 Tax=Microbacterium sp. TaxID=51671 RepID=UPI0039E428FC